MNNQIFIDNGLGSKLCNMCAPCLASSTPKIKAQYEPVGSKTSIKIEMNSKLQDDQIAQRKINNGNNIETCSSKPKLQSCMTKLTFGSCEIKTHCRRVFSNVSGVCQNERDQSLWKGVVVQSRKINTWASALIQNAKNHGSQMRVKRLR